jgi:1-acyl-sn-glycerol-3-phosphate acyltransferase
VGRLVGGMIRRSVRTRYRNVYWRCQEIPTAPAVLYVNHHSWMDGYLMFHVATRMNLVCMDWIEEFDAFPLFAYVGGLRYAKGDAAGRLKTIRETIRRMHDGASLVIFAEGVLHRPPDIFPLGKALELIHRQVPQAVFQPVAIYQEISMHERPEAWISVGKSHTFQSLEDCRQRLTETLERLTADSKGTQEFELLARGTPSVNERMDMRRMPKL